MFVSLHVTLHTEQLELSTFDLVDALVHIRIWLVQTLATYITIIKLS